jgi:probable phosphoglycerate mutase
MRLYIVRHADPDYDRNTITPAGHLEAQALARRLAGDGLTHIYTSPLNRARETARYTAELTKIEPVIEDWTQELGGLNVDLPQRSGDIETMVVWDAPGEIIRAADPLPTHETWHDLPLLRGLGIRQRFEQVIADSDAFIARHGYAREGGRYRIVCANQDQIAVFCHNGSGLTWLAHLLAIPLTLMWAGFWLAPSSVTTILFDERSDVWAVPRCLGLGDVSHLYEARLQVQPRGIRGNVR